MPSLPVAESSPVAAEDSEERVEGRRDGGHREQERVEGREDGGDREQEGGGGEERVEGRGDREQEGDGGGGEESVDAVVEEERATELAVERETGQVLGWESVQGDGEMKKEDKLERETKEGECERKEEERLVEMEAGPEGEVSIWGGGIVLASLQHPYTVCLCVCSIL